MLIRPELQVLQGNDALQRHAQQSIQHVLLTWRHSGPGRQAHAELVRFGDGTPLSKLPLLAALYDSDAGACRAFLNSLLPALLGVIAEQPVARSPLPFNSRDPFTTLILARSATATLTLQYVDGAALARQSAAQTISLAPTEMWERVVSGTAEARRVRVLAMAPDRAELDLAPVRLAAGDLRYRKGQDEALVLDRVATSLVQLRLQRRTSQTEPVREYNLEDGRLVHQATGTLRDSRLELTASLLGRMKRRDAAPMLAAIAHEHGPDSVRWQALRECLTLDTAIGFTALCTLAERSGDPLAQPAAALRTKLLQLHPELNGICPCPA